jgi:hypothetical protein
VQQRCSRGSTRLDGPQQRQGWRLSGIEVDNQYLARGVCEREDAIDVGWAAHQDQLAIAAGPTARSTATAKNAPQPLTDGSSTTTITANTQPSATSPDHSPQRANQPSRYLQLASRRRWQVARRGPGGRQLESSSAPILRPVAGLRPWRRIALDRRPGAARRVSAHPRRELPRRRLRSAPTLGRR